MSTESLANGSGPSSAPSSIEQRQQSARRAWRYSGILVLSSFAALLYGALAVALKMHDQQRDARLLDPDTDKTREIHDAGTTVQSSGSDDLLGPEQVQRFAQINGELQHAALQMELAQAAHTLRHLESAENDWSELRDLTLHDDVGRRIAGDKELLLRFIALSRTSGSKQAAEDLSADLIAIQREVKEAKDENTLRRLMVKARVTAARAPDALGASLARVNELHAIRKLAASCPDAELDLFHAIANRNSSVADERISAAQREQETLKAVLGNEYAELTKQRKEIAGLVASLRSQVADAENGESSHAASGTRPRLPMVSRKDYLRQLDRIRTDLVAFTTPGYAQPESQGKLVYRTVKCPFSFSALQRSGALEDSNEGRAILLRVGGSKTAASQNDRPLGNFPKLDANSALLPDEIVERLQNVQRLLRQFGPLMVDDGLLSP